MNDVPRGETFKEQFPHLFLDKWRVEDAAFLSRFGILKPGSENLPRGHVKYLPQDFVVEEVALTKNVATIIFPGKESILAELAQLPLHAPTYYATLVKCNITGHEVMKVLADALGISEDNIAYAGIKDQRAITAQRISIRGCTRERLKMALFGENYFLKDIEAGKGAITTGALFGNRFTILVRTEPDITEEKREIFFSALQSVIDNGFYNFFYLQRFGTPRLINYEWARSILKGDYEGAVKSIITKETPGEYDFFSEIRRQLHAIWGDYETMERVMKETAPDEFRHEQILVAHLKSHPGDYVGALALLKDQVGLWVYALFSRYFNQLISEHVKEGKTLPSELPLALSHVREDTAMYRKYFERDGLWPPPWKNLRPFPHIRTAHRTVKTISKVVIHSAEVLDAGIYFQFTLEKGQYATTFLSHLFDLVSGHKEGVTQFSLDDCTPLPSSVREYFAPVLLLAKNEKGVDI